MKPTPFSEQLRLRRYELGLMQTEVALAIDCKSPQEVSRWELGLAQPSNDQLERLVQFMKIDCNDRSAAQIDAPLTQTFRSNHA